MARYGADFDKLVDYKTRKFNYKAVKKVLLHIINILTDSKDIELPIESNFKEVEEELRQFYIRAIDLLKQPIFMKTILNLSVKEAIILALIFLSYLENREITLEDISNLLEINIDILRKYYKKVLIIFKDNINEYLAMNITNTNGITR